MLRRAFRVAFALSVLLPHMAAAKSLHWSRLDVTARLDGDGRLHVVEKQTIVFDGEWNGGERRFDVRPGQTLDFESLQEIENGATIRFEQKDLAEPRSWAWNAQNHLRWRARLPEDPPFINQTKIYVLTYSMAGVVMRRGDRYRLNHNFAFPDREGPIEHFTLDLTFDPAWSVPRDLPSHFESGPLAPGQGHLVTVALEHTGAGAKDARDLSQPLEAAPGPPPPAPGVGAAARRIVGVLVAAILMFLAVRFAAGELGRGRFTPLERNIDRRWLESHLLMLKPEVVGTAWDEKVGSAEVGALLARLENEGFIESKVVRKKRIIGTRNVLQLTKKGSWRTLKPHERWLLQSLFGNQEVTDTDKVRARYRGSGFDPVSGIARNLLDGVPWKKVKAFERSDWRRLNLSIAIYVAGVVATAILSSMEDALLLFGWGFAAAIVTPLLALAAYQSRKIVGVPTAAVLIALMPALVFVGFWRGSFFSAADIRWPALLLLGFLAVVVMNTVTRIAATVGDEERIAWRKRLLAARRYLRRELRSDTPSLDDSWFPYLIAFGLGRDIDRWFKAFGGATNIANDWAPAGGMSSGGASASPLSPGRGWTGGGGAFGGAGATGSWIGAMSGIASGVAAPSSSGGSSSSSGGSSSSSSGGGSSGGGGGGGW